MKGFLAFNNREEKLRFEKQQETKAFIGQFMREREKWKEEERKLQELENNKIMEYARLQKDREAGETRKKQLIAAGRDEIYDKVSRRFNL
jgi:hypothetical protein